MKNRLDTRILEILEWPALEEKLASLCASDAGKRLVTRLRPVPFNRIELQMKKISALRGLIERGAPPVLAGIADISIHTALASKGGTLAAEDLLLIRNFTAASGRIRAYLSAHKDEFPQLCDEHDRIDPLPELTRTLAAAITDDGRLNEEKYPVLKKIKNEIFGARQEIEKRISRIIHSPDNEKIIQEKTWTTSNGRYVILVKSGMRNKLNGNMHDISASGATVYFEPGELTGLNNNIIMLERELVLEIQKILAALSSKVAENADELNSNQRVLTYFDFITAAARLSMITRSSEPELTPEPMLRLYGAHHPLLYMMSPGTVVSNDIILGADYSGLVISGANTGGKTVLLKTVGLCALMAMYGLHIPAGPDSVTGIFSNIMADIGDDQNLSQSLSTFSGQLSIINDILRNADSSTLVIIDEIIVGTNPRQGAALAQAILEEMINTGSRIMVTTHYTELKELAVNDTRFRNASVTFNLESLKPTYELRVGIPGLSHAVEIARIFGMPEGILKRAETLVDSRESSVDALLEKVQHYEEEIRDERQKVQSLMDELRQERQRIETRSRELERLISETKKARGIEFVDEMNRYRDLISQRITSLQNLDMKDTTALHDELKRIQEDVHTRLKVEAHEKYSESLKPLDTASAKRGDPVFIASIETEGTFEEADSSGKTASVLLGGTIRSRFPVKDIFILPKSTGTSRRKQKSAITGAAEHFIPVTLQTSYNTIDLRGMRVDQALHQMEQSFDGMERRGINTVIIIHGHGTGAMKQAVREHLKMSIYISDYRPGDMGEGGDGVTVAKLRN